MPIARNALDPTRFNPGVALPYQLRIEDFRLAAQDVYDFFYDVNTGLMAKGLERLDDTLRPAIMSGVLSDMLTASMAKHSRTLTVNAYFNGHPDLVVRGQHPNNGQGRRAWRRNQDHSQGRRRGGHARRTQSMDGVFVYQIDGKSEPAVDRRSMTFTEIYLGQVTTDDFRRNERGELGTRTATLDAKGIAKLRQSWIYRA